MFVSEMSGFCISLIIILSDSIEKAEAHPTLISSFDIEGSCSEKIKFFYLLIVISTVSVCKVYPWESAQ